MPKRLRPIGHEDQLSVVDHLDELRSRLIVCASVLVVVFAVCFWQNPHLLNALNAPLKDLSNTARNHISGITGDQVGERSQLLNAVGDLQLLARSSTLAPGDRALIAAAASHFEGAAKALPSTSAGPTPITTRPGEPFTVSLTVSFYFAILISLPLLLYQLFAFIVPALRPREKAVALPTMIVAPVLFFAGVLFTYILVLPPAIKFLQGYNASQFQALVQAQPLYSFEVHDGLHRSRLRDAARAARPARSRGHRRQHPHQALALRDRDHRRDRRGNAGSRPGHDRLGDRPARRPISRQHRAAQGSRPARRPARGRRGTHAAWRRRLALVAPVARRDRLLRGFR